MAKKRVRKKSRKEKKKKEENQVQISASTPIIREEMPVLEESVDETGAEISTENFTDFFSSGSSPGATPSPAIKPERIIERENLERTTEETPVTANPPPQQVTYGEKIQAGYAVNMPEYGQTFYRISQEREKRRTDMEMDITQARLIQREQDVMRFNQAPQGMNLGDWQRKQEGMVPSQEDYYVARAKRKKEDDKLPFQ